ncbi:nucleoside kinase [Spirochaeta cellobiosiphila]|uniref:nucleoside kinase n=1 Tax=Spirochaeta cellobiosiphila TaxID=504483 RepID=UPI00040865E9|nr:nucleoside kinase [Spirochaeta cellobiosiphila]
MDKVKVSYPSGDVYEVPYGTRLKDLFGTHPLSTEDNPLAVKANNRTVNMSYRVKSNCQIELVKKDSTEGMHIYRDSLGYLLCLAAREEIPQLSINISHSLGDGYYYYSEEEDLSLYTDRLTQRMKVFVQEALSIDRITLSYEDSIQYFRQYKQKQTLELLAHQNSYQVSIYQCGEYWDVAHTTLVDNTKYLDTFELKPYGQGILLRGPLKGHVNRLASFKDYPKLFNVYQEYKEWGHILGVSSVGALNKINKEKSIPQFINLAEALQDKKIAQLADKVVASESKVVLIAGPSSSGKTTFTKKLSIQLNVLGLETDQISLDDYFLDREKTPLDEHGEYDFEAIEAINVDRLNDDLLQLFAGQKITLPRFDFKTGVSTDGPRLSLGPKSILLIEGIHGLNPELTPRIKRSDKFLIYVSALTQLNLDNHNRISTTDNRLIRRIVRDYNFRGYSALETIKRWPSVRKGEERNIFPYQESADGHFNSALDYELGVLRGRADLLLRQIKPYHKEYSEALRLLEFLDNFAMISEITVPPYSILREFIGHSGFHY